MSITRCVNVFQGTGQSVKPKGEGLFSRWNLLKGKAGNTSPAACLPFGAVACSPYSGGYSSGYGNYKPTGSRWPEPFIAGNKLIGFSHFTHSGSGAFGFYYNYLVVAPYINDKENSQNWKEFDQERARPGYYACRLTEENIQCEVTVANKVALHRYTSLNKKPLCISIDVSNNGLRQESKRLYSRSTESEMCVDANGVKGFVTMQGVKLYFYVRCKGIVSLWRNGVAEKSARMHLTETDDRFGCTFETIESCLEIKIGFSLVSEMRAMASVFATGDFDTVANIAELLWEKRLNAIQIYGVSESDREIFYSNYYHSLVKPCGWEKESFLWEEKGTFYLDFATLWDVYKTQIPLLFALHKDVGEGIVETLLCFGETQGKLFNALMLTSNMNVESTQACCLGCYVLYDAYVFGLVKETDRLLSVAKKEIGQYREAVLSGSIEKTTKLLDVTLIAAAYAELAEKLGKTEDAAYFAEIAERWVDGFGEDGLLKTEYPYYEGNHWNYSFRFVRDVQKRIALSGGKEKLKAQLDGFFAFTEDNEELNRFEGFNNETDMETPYFYHYVDGYERLADILEECYSVCFQKGREGLPGNNDSGGLSACYIWNFLGLFPMSGQEKLFLGIPRVQKAVLKLSSGKTLTIEKCGEGKKVKNVLFNGEEIAGYSISAQALLQGGVLQFNLVT